MFFQYEIMFLEKKLISSDKFKEIWIADVGFAGGVMVSGLERRNQPFEF